MNLGVGVAEWPLPRLWLGPPAIGALCHLFFGWGFGFPYENRLQKNEKTKTKKRCPYSNLANLEDLEECPQGNSKPGLDVEDV